MDSFGRGTGGRGASTGVMAATYQASVILSAILTTGLGQ